MGVLAEQALGIQTSACSLPQQTGHKGQGEHRDYHSAGEAGGRGCLPAADHCSGTLSSAGWLAGSSLRSKRCVSAVLHEQECCKIWGLCMHSTPMQLLKCNYEKYQQLNCEGIAKQLSTKKINWHAVIDASTERSPHVTGASVIRTS